jgi:hypothetical protein
MLTYLQQFERDFAGYREAGIEIIDATEGGLAKQHTTAMPLAEVLDRYATSPLPPLPTPSAESDPQHLAAVRKRVASVGGDIRMIRKTSLKTARLLRRMIRDLDDPAKMQRHFAALEPHRTAIDQRVTAFGIVNNLNQLGVYKRHRADRRLHMQPDLSPRDRQLAQIQRDLDNVNWTADAAGEIAHQLALTDRVLAGEQIAPAAGSSTALLTDVSVGAGPAKVAALVPVDPDRNGLGVRRSLAEPFGKDRSVLQATLERLGQAHKLDSIVLIAPEGFDVDAIIDRDRIGRSVHVHRCDGSPYGPEQEAIAAARRWSVTSWRGGIAGMSVYDEVLCPALMHRAMRERGLTAALVAGPDWPLIDPDDDTGCNAIIARHLELPDQHKLVFNQAPPGLAGCIVSAGIMEELTLRNRLSTIGGLLVYQPHAPQHDPIARSINVQIDHTVRRSRVRATFDAPRYRRLLSGALDSRAANLDATAIVKKLAEYAAGNPDEMPRHVVVELCTRRTSGGDNGATSSRPDLEPQLAARLFEQIAAAGDVVVTFAGAGDPLLHDRFDEILRMARHAGVLGVHVRTELLAGQPTLDRLLACEPDVVSVDLNADCPETYRRTMGLDRYQDVVSGMHYLVTQRTPLTDHSATASLALPWIVPRLRRCADTANDLDGFFQRWQATLGTAVIDPEPAGHDNPLLPVVVPPAVGLDDARHTMTVHCDGSIPVDGDPGHSVGNIARTPVAELWPELLRDREQRTEDR